MALSAKRWKGAGALMSISGVSAVTVGIQVRADNWLLLGILCTFVGIMVFSVGRFQESD